MVLLIGLRSYLKIFFFNAFAYFYISARAYFVIPCEALFFLKWGYKIYFQLTQHSGHSNNLSRQIQLYLAQVPGHIPVNVPGSHLHMQPREIGRAHV